MAGKPGKQEKVFTPFFPVKVGIGFRGDLGLAPPSAFPLVLSEALCSKMPVKECCSLLAPWQARLPIQLRLLATGRRVRAQHAAPQRPHAPLALLSNDSDVQPALSPAGHHVTSFPPLQYPVAIWTPVPVTLSCWELEQGSTILLAPLHPIPPVLCSSSPGSRDKAPTSC